MSRGGKAVVCFVADDLDTSCLLLDLFLELAAGSCFVAAADDDDEKDEADAAEG